MGMLADNVRALRLERGLTQSQLAERLGTVKASTISMIERGERKPSYELLEVLADYFNVSIARLRGEPNVVTLYGLPNILPIESRCIPLLGQIQRGEPTYADEEFEGYVVVGVEVQADFALRCKGDSMTGARIYDGDLVFVRQQDDVRDGEIAAVLIDDDEVTLKRVYKLADGRVELRAENPKYPPITIGENGDMRNFRVLGKAVACQINVL